MHKRQPSWLPFCALYRIFTLRPVANERRGRLPSLVALFAGDGAVADVLAVEAAVPADLLGQAVGLLLGAGNGWADGSGAQYATAGGDDRPIASGSPRVEYQHILESGRSVQSADLQPAGAGSRAATRWRLLRRGQKFKTAQS